MVSDDHISVDTCGSFDVARDSLAALSVAQSGDRAQRLRLSDRILVERL